MSKILTDKFQVIHWSKTCIINKKIFDHHYMINIYAAWNGCFVYIYTCIFIFHISYCFISLVTCYSWEDFHLQFVFNDPYCCNAVMNSQFHNLKSMKKMSYNAELLIHYRLHDEAASLGFILLWNNKGRCRATSPVCVLTDNSTEWGMLHAMLCYEKFMIWKI